MNPDLFILLFFALAIIIALTIFYLTQHPRTFKLTAATHPYLYRALLLIEQDNGGHLLEDYVVYDPLSHQFAPDLSFFRVPGCHVRRLAGVEAALATLHFWAVNNHQFEDAFATFVCGDEADQSTIRGAFQGRLEGAHNLLEDYFSGWDPDYDYG